MRTGLDAKTRNRAARWLKVYGLTIAAFNAILAAQGNRCAICRTLNQKATRNGVEVAWCVDHDHDTGEVRGLLCQQCNAGLGHFEDDPVLLYAAARYLELRGK